MPPLVEHVCHCIYALRMLLRKVIQFGAVSCQVVEFPGSAFGGDDFPLPTDGALTNYEAKYGIEGRNRHRGSWRRL